MRIGLISDTHGFLRAEARAFLQGCDHIVHAGDVTDASMIDALEKLAPLTVVRGNNDQGAWAQRIPETARLEIGGIVLYVIHDLALIDIDPRSAGVNVVISGHSHQPRIQRHDDGVLYVNPGSAGRRRFKLPVAVAELTIERGRVAARIVDLLDVTAG